MKNLFTYKNSIASSLKRYSKFLLLAVMFLAFNTQAWAAAPSKIYIKCNTTTNADDYADGAFYWVELTKVDGQNKWVSPKITLNNNNNTFYLATSQSDNTIFQKGITLGMKDFSPTCATNFDTDKDWGGKAKIYLGKANENPSCEVAFVITYKSDTEYTIQLDSPCIEAEPEVTTGIGTRNASNQLVISNNILNELYKDTHCDRKLDRLGVQMLGTDKTSDKGYYLFVKGASEEWLDYRGAAYTVTYPGTEEVCYHAFANYQNHYAYGEIKCTTPTPDPSGTTPVIRIGKQPVVINDKDVDLNFQLADWGCTEVTTVKVYYTTDGSDPTTSSYVEAFEGLAYNSNTNFTLKWENVPSGNYNIKAVACNSKGCGAMSDMASFVTQCDNPAAPTLNKTEATLCQGAEEQFTITNYTSELTYKVFKNGIETDIVITDGEFTLLESGEYVVKVKNNCSNYIPSETINVVVNSKPAAPTIFNSNRKSCTLQNVSFIIAMGNNVIITMNEGTTTTAPAPVDGNVYEGETVLATIANDLALVEDLVVDPTKDYTVTCYQYNAASLCYSEPVTFYISKNLAIITAVEVSNVTRISADVTVTANSGPVAGTSLAELYLEWRVKGSGDAWTGGSPNIVANPVYQITMLTEGTTYEVRAKAKNNSNCDGTGFGYSEIVEFTTYQDRFIYVRNAKKGEKAYTNFYYENENSEAVRGGAIYYAESTGMPNNTKGDANYYQNFNQGGKEAEIKFDDCDGYTWYGFRVSKEVLDGENYFYVRATNDKGIGGYYTHSEPIKVDNMNGDLYFTLCEGAAGDCVNSSYGYYGWKLVEAVAPYNGPKVHASGNDTQFNGNNFADFVALYVTDCSGKELKSYQWQYSETEDGEYTNYASVCSYTFDKKGAIKTEDGDAGQSNNIRPATQGYYRCVATYTDTSTATSAPLYVENVGGDAYTFESNLPIIMVNTNGVGFPNCNGLGGQTASKNAETLKEKRSVDVKIYEDGALKYDRKARMNYRGSSSLNFVKKSYAFCPGKADCVEDKGRKDYVKTDKLNMLGIGSACDKDWVLYAAAADPSLMRNRLAFDAFGAMTGTWSVNSRYVELIVDGQYKGVYVMMDKITNNVNRLDISNENGFIVKFDKTDKVDRFVNGHQADSDEKTFTTTLTGRKDIPTYDTQVDQMFEIEYPEKDDYPSTWAAKVNEIKDMFTQFETALTQKEFETVQKYIDYTSWADWFIITEYIKNLDGYRASNIFVYNGNKIEARPLWDQELGFNNTTSFNESNGCNLASGLMIENENAYKTSFPAPFWFTGNYTEPYVNGAYTPNKYAGLLDDPCFVQTVKERWELHKKNALSQNALQTLIAQYNDELTNGGAAEREVAFWKGKSRGTCDCSYDTGNATASGYKNTVTMSDSKSTIDAWVVDDFRRKGLSDALGDLVGTGLDISLMPEESFTTPWVPVSIQVNNESGYDYTFTYTDGALNSVQGVIVEQKGDTYTYRIPRPEAWGVGNETVEGEREDIVYGVKATLNITDNTMVCGNKAEAPSAEATITLQDEPNEDCD